MVIFFYFDNTIRVLHQEIDYIYEHRFDGIDMDQNPISFDRIYFSTPADFNNYMENIKEQIGEQSGNVHVVAPEKIVTHPQFPEHIGFQNLEEVVLKYRDRSIFKLAILNAMSNAIGDHLIGMQAFDYFYDQLQILMPGVELEISLFQINPYRLNVITQRWAGKFKHIHLLPNCLTKLVENDAFIDLGTLILRENFGNQPMIDFFLEALSVDPKKVAPERKRMQFRPSDVAMEHFKPIFHNLRLKGRPILLFHHTATTTVRQMTEPRARIFVNSIIENSDYFVVSADHLDFSHKRFRNLNPYSKRGINHFAAIIANVDAIISVDTLTYHLADALDIPTVVMFTTIEPEHRIKYYPFTEAIMLEKQDGCLYGKHKGTTDPEKAREEILYLDKKWETVDIPEVLQLLEKVKICKCANRRRIPT